jgi:uncharacterized membrane protein YtjA (UPF0391 family)
LTGFIPQLREARFRDPVSILFPAVRQISRFPDPERAGTFVPRLDYFLKRCAVLSVAAIKAEMENRGGVMLSWVITFLVVALIAGILGFGGIAGASIEIAKAIFFIAVILFLVSAVVGLARGRTRV